MDRVKILHTADIHIGAAESFLGAAAEQRRYETLLTFERILDLAVKNEVRLIALAGDIFDSNDIEGRFFEAVFAKIAALPQIKVVYAAGNHDPLNSQSPFINRPIPENLYVLGVKDDCITFDDLKLRVYGRSFENISLQGEENFGITPENDGYINLMVQHGELKSNLNSDYNAITPAFVKKCGMDYIALGHIHDLFRLLRLSRGAWLRRARRKGSVYRRNRQGNMRFEICAGGKTYAFARDRKYRRT